MKTLKDHIKENIKLVYPGLPDEFHGHQLTGPVINRVIYRTGHYPYADTVLRYFREMRDDGLINCDCLNREKSIYTKK